MSHCATDGSMKNARLGPVRPTESKDICAWLAFGLYAGPTCPLPTYEKWLTWIGSPLKAVRFKITDG